MVRGLDVFERNRVPFELKVLGLAFYIQLSSFRMASRALSEIRKVSKTAVGSGFWKFSGRINVNNLEYLEDL